MELWLFVHILMDIHSVHPGLSDSVLNHKTEEIWQIDLMLMGWALSIKGPN